MAKIKTTTGAALKGVPGNIKSPWKMPKAAGHPRTVAAVKRGGGKVGKGAKGGK